MEDLTPAATAAVAAPVITQCAACNEHVSPENVYCNNCGYPLKGTEDEQKQFMNDLTIKEIDMADYQQKIRKGGNSLYYVAVAFALGTLLDMSKDTDHASTSSILIGGLVICGLFVFLGMWARRKPFAAMVSGAVLFALIVILAAIVNPLTLVSGIFLKIFVVGCLVQGLRAAMDAEKLKKETHLR